MIAAITYKHICLDENDKTTDIALSISDIRKALCLMAANYELCIRMQSCNATPLLVLLWRSTSGAEH